MGKGEVGLPSELTTPFEMLLRTQAALVLLDPENRFFWQYQDGPELGAASILPNLVRVLSAARTKGVPRVFVNVLADPKTDSDAWQRRRLLLRKGMATELDASPWGTALVDSLTPSAEEMVITKLRLSAFHATSLETYLRNCHVETLVLAGVASNGAVLATAFDAVSRDLHTLVLEDATVGTTDELHASAMAVIGRDNVMTVAELCRAWERGQ